MAQSTHDKIRISRIHSVEAEDHYHELFNNAEARRSPGSVQRMNTVNPFAAIQVLVARSQSIEKIGASFSSATIGKATIPLTTPSILGLIASNRY